MLQIGVGPGIGGVRVGYLIIIIAVDANDVIVPQGSKYRPSVVPIPDLGLAAFFTSGGEMNTIWRGLVLAQLGTILLRLCIRGAL